MKLDHKRKALFALFLLFAFALACTDETGKANKLVDEGNKLVDEANKLWADANGKQEKMKSAVDQISSDNTEADLEKARSIAKEVIDAYDKAKNKCTEAAKKYEEGSGFKINEKFKEYLKLKADEFKKRAEMSESAKGVAQALISSENKNDYTKKSAESDEKTEKLRKEAQDLADKANTIQKENKDIFKQ
jgi:hypothetical protein